MAADGGAGGHIERMTEAELAALRDDLYARAALAREDPVEFLEFVMREEHTRQPIKIAPHQRVMLEFILHHDRSVLIVAIGHSKTFLLTALTIWLLGRDPTSRGAIVCASESQAKKVLSVVRDYIEGASGAELGLVFPDLQRSPREGDPWTQTALTVARPAGIKDPSLVAVGLDSARIVGSRLNWIIVDDVLNAENTGTKEQRDKVQEFVAGVAVMGRLDPVGARVVLTNSPWHVDDLPHRLEANGWPTLRMTIDGDVTVQDDRPAMEDAIAEGLPWEPWDSDQLRPEHPGKVGVHAKCRLVAHDPDPGNKVRLWPERFTDKAVSDIRRKLPPWEYNRSYRCMVHDDALSMCKREYIDKCLARAREHGVFRMVGEYKGPNLTVTGVDLAVSPGEESDDTSLVTVEFRPGGWRVVLDVETGKFSGPLIVQKIFEKHRAYNSIVRVENNAAQDFIRQFALDPKYGGDISLPIQAHTTGRVKAHPEHGIPGIIVEMSNGAWLFPNEKGVVHPMVRRLLDACLYYAPSKHTDDPLMALYFAREQARLWGALVDPVEDSTVANIGSEIMRR